MKRMKELERVKQKIESIENYVFSISQPKLEQLASNSQLFWSKYRPLNDICYEMLTKF